MFNYVLSREFYSSSAGLQLALSGVLSYDEAEFSVKDNVVAPSVECTTILDSSLKNANKYYASNALAVQ